MRAIVHTTYGGPDVLELKEIAKPAPADNEVLIKIMATTVTAAETAMRKGEPRWGRIILGFRRPRKPMRVMGNELAGEVESIGKSVRRFNVGDQVYGFTGFSLGAYAEYKCLPETGSLALKPVNTTFEEAAAAVDGATTALYFLRDRAKVHSGQRVLINGASGSIGTYAVQLAKHFGAHVTAVCSARNAALVTELGADKVLDYTAEDFTRNGETYDIIFDTVTKSSFAQSKASLRPGGRYLPTTGLKNVVLALWTSMASRKVVAGMSVNKSAGLLFLKDLIESGRLRIVIDRRFPLAQIADAHRYVDTGHKTGNVVITVSG